MKQRGIPKLLEAGKELPFIVLAPQSPSWWSYNNPSVFLDWLKTKYNIDPSRVYLTGISIGGTETWKLGISKADEFAAILPLGGKPASSLDYCQLTNTPTWALHGEKDHIYKPSYTRDAITKLNSCRPAPSPAAKFTQYAGVGHDDLWDYVYTGSKGDDVYSWFLNYKLDDNNNPPSNRAPTAYAGEDKTTTLPNNSLKLTGTGTDSDGNITAYQWKKTYGPSVRMSGEATSTLSLTKLVEGNYTFSFTVTDNGGLNDTDYVVVRVRPQDDDDDNDDDDDDNDDNDDDDDDVSSPTNYIVKVNFNRDSPTSNNEWNNLNSTTEAGKSFRLNYTDKKSSGIRLHLLTTWGYSNNKAGEHNMGMTSGLYPSDVVKHGFWTAKTTDETLKLTGLKTDGTYALTFFASRNGGGDRTTIYSVNGKQGSLNASYNRNNTVTLSNLSANNKGELIIIVRKASSASFGYLNAMVITYTGNSNSRVANTSAEIAEQTQPSQEQPTRIAYNQQKLSVFNSEDEHATSIIAVDLAGNSYTLSPQVTDGELSEFNAASLPSGVYTAIIKTNKNRVKKVRFLKGD
jgi:hypothetical protein